MPVSSWSTTAASNGATLGIDIAENCDAANVNNAIREVMAQAKTKFDSIDSTIAGLDVTPDTTVLVKTGSIIMFGGSTAPADYLECNGTAVSRTTYSALFAVIGTNFGAGDGSTTFALPDFRGYFPRGWDHGRGIDSGRAMGSTQADANLAHTHTLTGNPGGSPGSNIEQGTAGSTATITTSSSGDSEARPKNLAVMFVIKT